MNRRDYLRGMAAIAAVSALRNEDAEPRSANTVEIVLDPRRTGKSISPQFMGLGYEISSVAVKGLLHPENRAYVQMVRTLSSKGVIRVGGNASDYAAWSPHEEAVAAPKETIVNEQTLKELAGFLRTTGWTLIWGINLGQNRESEAVAEAKAVAAIVGVKFVTFEIGNEPDLFTPSHRTPGYGYEQWREQYQSYAAHIAKAVPGAVFAGPDVAGHTDWVAKFAEHAPENVELLTHHYYAEGPPQNPTSTIDTLLKTDPKLIRILTQMQETSHTTNLPYRICETNSCYGGGKPGVSDTFASALWALDYMFTLAVAGAQGLNMQTGVNQLGFVSSYSPIVAREDGGYVARPIYYGMLAFAQPNGGRILQLDNEAAVGKLKAYAVAGEKGALFLTLINKNASQNIEARVSFPKTFQSVSTTSLSAPSLESKTDVTLGRTAVSSNGLWKQAAQHTRSIRDGIFEIGVPAASALLLKLTSA